MNIKEFIESEGSLTGLPLLFFRYEFTETELSNLRRHAEEGDRIAGYYIKFLRAKNANDYSTLADYIPENWVSFFEEDYFNLLATVKKDMLNAIAQNTWKLVSSKTRKNEQKPDTALTKEDKCAAAEMKAADEEFFHKKAKRSLFIKVFASVLQKDAKGDYIIPAPFLERLNGGSHDKVIKAVERN